MFWDFKVFQDSMVNLWIELANYYKDNTWIAGYNPLNEPAVADHSKLVKFYERVEKEIRNIDPNHILFLDGNVESIGLLLYLTSSRSVVRTLYGLT
jgi:hypothetical protein